MQINPLNQSYIQFQRLSNWREIKNYDITVKEFYKLTGVSLYIIDENFYRKLCIADPTLPEYSSRHMWVPQTINTSKMTIDEIYHSHSTNLTFRNLCIVEKLKEKVENYDFYAYIHPYTNFRDIENIYSVSNTPIERFSQFEQYKVSIMVKDKDYYHALLNKTTPQFIHENQLTGKEIFPLAINNMPVTVDTILSCDTINNKVGVIIYSNEREAFKELVYKIN